MNKYNDSYDKLIEPQYGAKRDSIKDNLLLKSNTTQHMYNVIERIDMTMHATYSIDPEGCEDADDAFSIYEENGKLFLAIHIADPTEYINIQSSLWKDLEKRIVTRYPSNKQPIHMIPKEIMDKSSLMVNQYGNMKLAITIMTEIDQNTYEPINGIKLLFTKIRVEESNALSYKKAGEDFDINNTIIHGLRISNALYTLRSKKTRGTVLNEISNSFPKIVDGKMYLYSDTKQEIMMKQMIAEFAIFANTFVGEYLKINFNGAGIYRICNAKDWLNTVYPEITGQELLNEIIVNGIRAEYLSTVNSHDLVGAPEYSHFTSPIRRLSDCVCHYLLKYIHLKNTVSDLQVPFSNDQLKKYSNDCVKLTKSIKNIQHKDTKFRLIQAMSQLLLIHESIDIGYFITSYTGGFLNIIVNKINEHKVYLSYILRIYDLQAEYTPKLEKQLTITKVNCMGAYDEGSIPELDNLFIQLE